MGKAYKCDRCGMFYEKNSVPAGKRTNRYLGGIATFSTSGDIDDQRDLCDACLYAFGDWMCGYDARYNEVEYLTRRLEEIKAMTVSEAEGKAVDKPCS